MKLTDGTRTIEIIMKVQQDNRHSPDWSNDFFEAAKLKYNPETDAYTVEDIDYCIDQANDWKESIGDFSGEEPNENKTVFIAEL